MKAISSAIIGGETERNPFDLRRSDERIDRSDKATQQEIQEKENGQVALRAYPPIDKVGKQSNAREQNRV
jgi:hypothetical protein